MRDFNKTVYNKISLRFARGTKKKKNETILCVDEKGEIAHEI